MDIILSILLALVVALLVGLLLSMLMLVYTLITVSIYKCRYKKGLYKVLKEFEYTDGVVYDGYDAIGSYAPTFIHTEYTGLIEKHTQPEVFDKLIKDGILEEC